MHRAGLAVWRAPDYLFGPAAAVTRCGLAFVFVAAWGASAAAQTQPQNPRLALDIVGDTARRAFMNLGPNPAIPPAGNHPLPDLHWYRIGAWQPTDPALDLFRGGWLSGAPFFRLDLALAGVVNPPGTIGCCGDPLDPFRFGPRPLMGSVEIDMDADADTGGDLDFPHLFYLGNAGRFGGLPAQARFSNRAAADDRAFDGDITSPPFVDRSGEEFHIAFDGSEILGIERSDDSDFAFDAGETWILVGRLFHRAAGYEQFSTACCSGPPNSYNPIVRIQFAHALETNRTVVSLVYPLTNAGSAALGGPGPTEALDNVVDNQNSVHEALNELVVSASIAPAADRHDPNFAILAEWQFKDPLDYLDPLGWEVTMLLGGSYREVAGGDIIHSWSDLYPNVLAGDFDGDGTAGLDDVAALDAFVAAHDGGAAMDQDQAVNGVVTLINFVPNFSVFDLNYDGLVDEDDRSSFIDFGPYDGDADGDVDLRDYAVFQRCHGAAASGPLTQNCSRFDGNADGVLSAEDTAGFVSAMTGPE